MIPEVSLKMLERPRVIKGGGGYKYNKTKINSFLL